MKRGTAPCRNISGWLKVSGLIYALLLLYHESFCYMLLPWSWPSTGMLETLYPQLQVHNDGDLSSGHVLRILLAADPQIQGEKNEPQGILGMITRWDADRYLQKTFHQAAHFVDPHLVVFLGDLLDEGTITFGNSYKEYAKRFHEIFALPNVKVIYVPGDNDIGGEGGEPVREENIERFRTDFPSDASSFWDKSIQLIEFSGLTEPVVLSNISDRKRPTILLGHMPVVLRNPDPAASRAINELRPTLIFSAHDHKASMKSRSFSDDTPQSSSMSSDFSIFDLSGNPRNIQEIVVPTCSYRMGVPKMGYGLAVIDLTRNRLFYTVLWLPPRYPHLFMELGLTVGLCLSLLFCFVLHKYRRNRRAKVRFSV